MWSDFMDIAMCSNYMDLVPSKFSSIRFNQPWVNTRIKQICIEGYHCIIELDLATGEGEWLEQILASYSYIIPKSLLNMNVVWHTPITSPILLILKLKIKLVLYQEPAPASNWNPPDENTIDDDLEKLSWTTSLFQFLQERILTC